MAASYDVRPATDGLAVTAGASDLPKRQGAFPACFLSNDGGTVEVTMVSGAELSINALAGVLYPLQVSKIRSGTGVIVFWN